MINNDRSYVVRGMNPAYELFVTWREPGANGMT